MHGSTALQVGGGAFGVLIVEDAQDEVPTDIANMEEVVLMLGHIDMEGDLTNLSPTPSNLPPSPLNHSPLYPTTTLT